MITSQIEIVKQLLSSNKQITIVSHRSPDGDAIGSSLAMMLYLRKKGHRVTVVLPNEFPDFFRWMPNQEEIILFEEELEKATPILKAAEVIFTLDFNTLSRVGKMAEVIETCKCSFVMIDHHYEPSNYATATFSDTQKSSTCQMVYDFIEALGDENYIDSAIADCLYTGIMTDSGSFRFPRTTAALHRVVAKLLDRGANNVAIHSNVFDSFTPDRLKLLGKALSNLIVLQDLHTAYITLTRQDLDTYNFQRGDTEGFVNYALSLKGIIFAAIFTESREDNCVKISFRSKGAFDVNIFSKNYFGGGGHKNASGARSEDDLDRTVSKFLSCIQHESQNLKSV